MPPILVATLVLLAVAAVPVAIWQMIRWRRRQWFADFCGELGLRPVYTSEPEAREVERELIGLGLADGLAHTSRVYRGTLHGWKLDLVPYRGMVVTDLEAKGSAERRSVLPVHEELPALEVAVVILRDESMDLPGVILEPHGRMERWLRGNYEQRADPFDDRYRFIVGRKTGRRLFNREARRLIGESPHWWNVRGHGSFAMFFPDVNHPIVGRALEQFIADATLVAASMREAAKRMASDPAEAGSESAAAR